MTIYAITEGPRAAVKFGYTKRAHPGRRKSALQLSNPRKLVLLWHGPGELEDEAALHALLAPSRASGEWFHRTDLVTLALIVLPLIGVRGLIDLGRDGLLTFVPVSGRFPSRFDKGAAVIMANWWALTPKGQTYWPEWETGA